MRTERFEPSLFHDQLLSMGAATLIEKEMFSGVDCMGGRREKMQRGHGTKVHTEEKKGL